MSENYGYGVKAIADERERQIKEEGWTAAHDDEYKFEEIANAASCYALSPCARKYEQGMGDMYTLAPINWPWRAKWWKPMPKDREKELIKAGALIAAELDRLNRLK